MASEYVHQSLTSFFVPIGFIGPQSVLVMGWLHYMSLTGPAWFDQYLVIAMHISNVQTYMIP